jgi:isocitrate dehydrogenase kinase/phosphatase
MVHKADMPGINGMKGIKDDCKKKDAEILGKIIFHLSEAYKLFNDLKDRRISTFEQSQWENAVKSCKDAIEFMNAKVDSIGKILR